MQSGGGGIGRQGRPNIGESEIARRVTSTSTLVDTDGIGSQTKQTCVHGVHSCFEYTLWAYMWMCVCVCCILYVLCGCGSRGQKKKGPATLPPPHRQATQGVAHRRHAQLEDQHGAAAVAEAQLGGAHARQHPRPGVRPGGGARRGGERGARVVRHRRSRMPRPLSIKRNQATPPTKENDWGRGRFFAAFKSRNWQMKFFSCLTRIIGIPFWMEFFSFVY